MTTFEVTEAKRELIYVKLALIAPSGGGKSYSSLRLATGMLEELKRLGLEKNGKILVGNTEGPRGRYYANEFKYDIVDIGAPHSPEKYVEFFEWAVDKNYPIVILDSSSHEWEGRGGCLEINQLLGGTYQSWAKTTPRHEKFVTAIAESPIHVIATMRGKDQYEMEKSDAGKTTVKKLGVGAQQRTGVEYEFTASFLIDQKSNQAVSQKDNTHLFEHEGEILLSENHGKQLIVWANSGEGYTPSVKYAELNAENKPEPTASDVVTKKDLQLKVIARLKELGGTKNEAVVALVKEYDPSANPNKIKELSKLEELYEKLLNFGKEQ